MNQSDCLDPIQNLLPWYVNNTLEPSYREMVEQHLQACHKCRGTVVFYQRLMETLSDQPIEGGTPDVQSLLARLPPRKPATHWVPSPLINRSFPRWAWELLRAQARIVRGEIWVASALVMSLGALVTLLFATPAPSPTDLPFILIAPIVAAVGVSFLYGSEGDPALELELATPTPPVLILLSRLALVFSFDCALGLIGSLILALLHSGLSVKPLLIAWLAPMAFLSGMAFLLTVLSNEPGLSVLFCMGLWTLQNASRLMDFPGFFWRLPDLTSAAARPWLWGLALILTALALKIGSQGERWLRHGA